MKKNIIILIVLVLGCVSSEKIDVQVNGKKVYLSGVEQSEDYVIEYIKSNKNISEIFYTTDSKSSTGFLSKIKSCTNLYNIKLKVKLPRGDFYEGEDEGKYEPGPFD